MVKGHHLQLKYHLPLFWNFGWFNIKSTPAHHSIIQKVNKLLVKSAIEPSTGGACFYSKIYVVTKCKVAYIPSLIISDLVILFTYLLLRCLLLYRYGYLFNGRLCFFY